MKAVSDASVASGEAALEEGRWEDARASFESALASGEDAGALMGLATARWWLWDSRPSVTHATRAYVLFRRAGDTEAAVRAAVWLAITYKANFSNFAAANGWLRRAERLLAPAEPATWRGWLHVARAYRMADLTTAAALASEAADLARAADDTDLELVALSQLGLIRVGQGHIDAGFALIDEAMAAALAGERANLETVVYTCCDMLNACELASDVERAAQWCRVADDFVDRYGCPFLYAECRIFYGSVLAAKGRWTDAERELSAGLRIAEEGLPGLRARAQARLAVLRVRQGRLEDASSLLSSAGTDAEAETALSVAALHLARGDAAAAQRQLAHRLSRLAEHRIHLGAALDLLVDAALASNDLDRAATAVERLTALSRAAGSEHLVALAQAAGGRLQLGRGDAEAAAADLQQALAAWTRLSMPFEAARSRCELGRALLGTDPDAAAAQLRRALDELDALGAALHADRVAAELRALGAPARVGARDVGLLTDRERQVLSLLAAGLSNPEIAERLYVSRKTASHHVSHILTKLNLRNRAEAAAYAATASSATVRKR